MSKPGVERRSHPRVRTRVQLQGSPEQGGVVARMVTTNLSLAGLHCTSSAHFPEMTRLAVRLLLPSGNGKGDTLPLDLEAVVVRSVEASPSAAGDARFELGLYFTKIDDADRQRLASFIGTNAVPSSIH